MADVTVTRGIIFREDALVSGSQSGSMTGLGGWTLTQSASHTAVSATADGDAITLQGVFTSAVNNDYVAISIYPTGSPSTTTYPKLMIRHRDGGGLGNPSPQLQVNYTDATSDTFTLGTGTVYALPETFTLTMGKQISNANGMTVYLKATGNVSGTFTLTVDFVQVFKETLTLPGITQAMPVSAGRIVAVLPILQREGEVLQDLGSKSPEIIIQGPLVSTTTPTNHTAAEWWDLLEGLVLEGANETWQWVNSDRIHYKYLPIDLTRSEILSRKNYYEFTLRLKRFDVLSQTAANLGISY